jgi:uncharacterized protein (TIGR00661 family)
LANLNKILIVPLDWGLGHATRSIPLIMNLLINNCEVYVAGEGATLALLKSEFSQVKFLPLSGYRIHYAKQQRWLPLKIIIQIPRIIFSIYHEHKWLKKIVKRYSIDAVISDNRFGLYHSQIPSVYITHQLLIKTGNKFSENLLRKCHYWFIKKYTQCWIPDFEGADNIAGQLSHPSQTLPNIQYIGCLSRFEKNNTESIKYDLLILLSGPEPQRTLFENELLLQLQQFTGHVLLVRGLPETDKNLVLLKNSRASIVIKNHFIAQELSKVIQQSAMVICRAGYTTIMDLLKLQKKAILVPTPAQTEQEYLGRYLMQQQLFLCIGQQNFLLMDALENAAAFNFLTKEYDMEKYKQIIHQFIINGG